MSRESSRTVTYGIAKLIEDVIQEIELRGEDVPDWKIREVTVLINRALVLLQSKDERRGRDRRA